MSVKMAFRGERTSLGYEIMQHKNICYRITNDRRLLLLKPKKENVHQCTTFSDVTIPALQVSSGFADNNSSNSSQSHRTKKYIFRFSETHNWCLIHQCIQKNRQKSSPKLAQTALWLTLGNYIHGHKNIKTYDKTCPGHIHLIQTSLTKMDLIC